MGYRVTVNMPNLPQKEPVHITGLGVFLNGDSRVVSDQEELTWRQLTGQFREGTPSGETGNFEVGKTLMEAAQTMYGVTVTEVPEGSA